MLPAVSEHHNTASFVGLRGKLYILLQPFCGGDDACLYPVHTPQNVFVWNFLIYIKCHGDKEKNAGDNLREQYKSGKAEVGFLVLL